ncbi:MAG: methyltransferase domain-containing protein [Candidatus Hodarchaeales archaeon]
MRELIAAEVLARVYEKRSTIRKEFRVLENQGKLKELSVQARGTAFSLAIETTRRQNTVDRIINQALREKIISTRIGSIADSVKLISSFERAIYRISTYRMFFEKHTAALVTNTAVNCLKAKSLKNIREANQLLRVIEKIDLDKMINGMTDIAEKIGLSTFHSTWFVRQMMNELGEKRAIAFLEGNNDNPTIYFRINQLKDVEEIKKSLATDGVNYHADKDLDDVYVLDSTSKPLPRLKSFKEGDFYIQAKSSALVPHVLKPGEEEKILDACAAPGGKTFHMAELTGNKARIVATDISENRLSAMEENIRKYRIKNIKCLVHDFRKPFLERGLFDKILVDSPCTGSGTFQSRPEGKWRLNKRLLKYYTSIQKKILENCCGLLKNGGKLLYSTCSVFMNENEDIIRWFIEKHDGYSPVKQDPFIGCDTEFFGQRLFPDIHKTEGFSLFLLEKNS